MKNEWIYISYNRTTEMYDVLKQVKGISGDETLKSFKRKGNAVNYELKLFSENFDRNSIIDKLNKISNN